MALMGRSCLWALGMNLWYQVKKESGAAGHGVAKEARELLCTNRLVPLCKRTGYQSTTCRPSSSGSGRSLLGLSFFRHPASFQEAERELSMKIGKRQLGKDYSLVHIWSALDGSWRWVIFCPLPYT